MLKGPNSSIWNKSLSNEWGRLAQGNIHGVRSTDTIDFILKKEVPNGTTVTYATYVLDYRPLKEEPYRVRITVGGNKLHYTDDAGSPAANLLETKVLINSTISEASRGARFMTADINDFFLASPMKKPEFMKVHIRHIPQDIIQRYDISSKVTVDGYVYIRIKKGMYGLKQAAILAYQQLKNVLKPHGYSPVQGTVGLWHHHTRPTKFYLCVDDFGIKYYTKEDAYHLLNAIGTSYKYTTDWTGENYCGLNIAWNYTKQYVDISMNNYVTNSLNKLQYKQHIYPQYSPHHHNPINYTSKERQYATAPDTAPLLGPHDTKKIQSITGTYLYYARAVDPTILPALNEIAAQQAHPTKSTEQKAQRLMDYLNTYPNASIRYHASDMILHIDSDAVYLVAPKSRSRVAGFYYLSNHPTPQHQANLNGSILVECKTLRHVVSSAVEAEVGGIFHNAQTTIPIRTLLQALGHHQPPTPIKTDNATANGFVHDNIYKKRSKSWDMRYYWLRDRSIKKQFNIFWAKAILNLADYFTKHHPTKHHRATRHTYVQDK